MVFQVSLLRFDLLRITNYDYMESQKPLPKNLEVNLDQFIGTFKNAFEPEYCQRAIKYFERMDEMGFGYSRVQLENAPSHLKDTISYNTSRGVANVLRNNKLQACQTYKIIFQKERGVALTFTQKNFQVLKHKTLWVCLN